MQQQFRSSSPETKIYDISSFIPANIRLICVDGHSGVGKSRIAKALAPLRGSRLIHVDDFIRRAAGPKYVPKVDQERLHEAVSMALIKGSAVVDGLCINHLVPVATFGRGFRIYVRSDAYGDGVDAEEERRKEFGTNLYNRRYMPEATADLIIIVPYEF